MHPGSNFGCELQEKLSPVPFVKVGQNVTEEHELWSLLIGDL